jgi:hypothetical protein
VGTTTRMRVWRLNQLIKFLTFLVETTIHRSRMPIQIFRWKHQYLILVSSSYFNFVRVATTKPLHLPPSSQISSTIISTSFSPCVIFFSNCCLQTLFSLPLGRFPFSYMVIILLSVISSFLHKTCSYRLIGLLLLINIFHPHCQKCHWTEKSR